MDIASVQAIVDRELPPLCKQMGVTFWKIVVEYRCEDQDTDGRLRRGECTRLIDYLDACITLNPEAFDDEAMVLRTLRHELFHVILAPFDLFKAVVDNAVEDRIKSAMLNRVWHHALETAVIGLEVMWERMDGERKRS